MDYNEVKALLDRYFAGETTLAEEARLRAYFQRPDVPPEWLPYQPLFVYWAAEREQVPSARFDARLATAPPQPPLRVAWRRPARLRRLAVAAALVAALTVGYAVWPVAQAEDKAVAAIDWSEYEPKDEAEAMRQIQVALSKTATSLQHGMRTASEQLDQVGKLVQPLE